MRGVRRALVALAAAAPLVMYGQGLASATDTWSLQPVPALGSPQAYLRGVSCTSAASCVAVGWTNVGEDSALGAIWNGSTWTSQQLPMPSNSYFGGDGQPVAVSCPAVDSCVAIGRYYGPDNWTPLAETWNGSTWTDGTPPPRKDAGPWYLTAISCTSASSCVAVGGSDFKAGADAWNGSTWTLTFPITPAGAHAYLNGVSCVSPDDCVAVGGYSVKASHVLIEDWNGSTWTRQPAPSPAGVSGAGLTGVSCPAADNCTAVGNGSSASADVVFAENWNGSHWTVHSIPKPTGTGIDPELSAVSCFSADSCIAVGQVSGKSLAERYNGHTWFVEATARPEAGKSFSAVSCFAPATCTAVGEGIPKTGFGPNSLAEQN